MAIPALLAGGGGTSSSNPGRGKRHLVGLVLESGEVREVHHFATPGRVWLQRY